MSAFPPETVLPHLRSAFLFSRRPVAHRCCVNHSDQGLQTSMALNKGSEPPWHSALWSAPKSSNLTRWQHLSQLFPLKLRSLIWLQGDYSPLLLHLWRRLQGSRLLSSYQGLSEPTCLGGSVLRTISPSLYGILASPKAFQTHSALSPWIQPGLFENIITSVLHMDLFLVTIP